MLKKMTAAIIATLIAISAMHLAGCGEKSFEQQLKDHEEQKQKEGNK